MKKYIALLLALCLLPVAALTAAPLEEKGYTYLVEDENATILSYQGDESNLVLPETLGGKPVTKLGEEAFAYQKLVSITLPKSLTTTGINPFLGCSAQVLPGENERFTVEAGAVLDTQTNTMVAYLSCGEESFQVPEGVRVIAPRAFYGHQTLKSVTLPQSVEELGEEAFTECIKLEQIVLPEGLKAIAGQTFMGCVSLKEVKLPSTLLTIGDWAFAKGGLENIVVPEGVTAIGDWAFLRCHNLVGVTLPKSLESLSESAFDSISPEALFTVTEGTLGEQWVQDSEYNYQLADM